MNSKMGTDIKMSRQQIAHIHFRYLKYKIIECENHKFSLKVTGRNGL